MRGKDDIEGIRLRRREADGLIPWIPVVRAMVFGSFVHRCIGEIFVSQVGWLVRPPHIMRQIVQESRQSSAFRRLLRKVETWPSQSCGCGSDPGPLSLPPGPKAASDRCFVLHHTVASWLSTAVQRGRKMVMPTRGGSNHSLDSGLLVPYVQILRTRRRIGEKTLSQVRWLGSKLLASSR